MSATSFTFGRDTKYVGERWSIVTCSHSPAIAGTSVAAVAPEPITSTCLPAEVDVGRPRLRMHDLAPIVVHARPVGCVALLVAVVALAHPQEVGGERHRLGDAGRGVGAGRVHGPEVVVARPLRRRDRMVVADVATEVVLLDDLAHVGEDLVGGGDRRADPRLEPVAERVQVAVGADAGVLVRQPRAAEALELLEDDERLLRVLVLQVVSGTDAGDAGPDDQDVEVLDRSTGGLFERAADLAHLALLGSMAASRNGGATPQVTIPARIAPMGELRGRVDLSPV